jgi:hypothetical protein
MACGGRTLDQLRADHLVAAVLGEAPTDTNPRAVVADVSVVVSAATLLGQDDEPGWLDGYGPITADTARAVAHDPTGTWRRLITDPTSGGLLDHGTTRYRPPAALREFVLARDGQCRFPHCTQAARHGDLDHVIPFPDGPTASTNLAASSRRHHRAKTHGGWKLRLSSRDAAATWTSPHGRKYSTRPQQRWTLPEDKYLIPTDPPF